MTAAGLVEGKRVCVCAGPGGVGKTTVSAALAAGLAARGQRVCVVTIDPARRLADALGLSELGNDERRVAPERLDAAGIGSAGELWALTLDAKRTWDELIDRYAPDARTRDAILANPIYRELSSAVAGTQEYMAMEKLYELHEQGGYDVVVLDTPPTPNALDFLDAPARLLRFVDSRALRVLTAPSRLGLRLLGRGGGAALAVLERLTGVDLLRDVGEFLRSFESMTGDFSARAARVEQLLGDPTTAFLAIAAPTEGAVSETLSLARGLRERRMRLAGVIVNRLHDSAGSPAVEHELAQLVGADLAARVVRSAHDLERLAKRDHGGVERLRRELGGAPLVLVPELDAGADELAGLARVSEHLLAPG